ncbi:MAG: sulfite exporter TauE/SafE family protein [Flavobacterium sp.]
MIIIIGYIGALLIGLILGLTGGGGSILTVPILVYFLNYPPITATAYSLFIVGITSAFGAVQNFRKGIVEVKTALLFAIPTFVAVFITRKFIVPEIPETIIELPFFILSKNNFLMLLFACIMLAASFSMLKSKKEKKSNKQQSNFYLFTAIIKLILIGILIGLVGAGGGFLIVPALFFIANMPMKKAVGSSILIIAINSLIGFTGDIGNLVIDWQFLLSFSSVAIFGIFSGIYLTKYINENQLKKGFGWFVLVMGIFIFTKELFF